VCVCLVEKQPTNENGVVIADEVFNTY